MTTEESTRCQQCGAETDDPFEVGTEGLNIGLCEDCADTMIACEHRKVTKKQRFDREGRQVYTTRCQECGYMELPRGK